MLRSSTSVPQGIPLLPRPGRKCCAALFFTLLLLLLAFPGNSQPVPTGQLRIKVVKGEGDTHLPGDHVGKPLEVEVRNDVDLPQPAAEVVFTVPPEGPHVWLAKDKSKKPLVELKVVSDDEGIARVDNLVGKKPLGPVAIDVKASYAGKSGANTINQVVQRGPAISRKMAFVIGA